MRRRNASRARTVVTALVVASLTLVVLDTQESADPVTNEIRAAGDFVFAPVAAGVSAAVRPLDDVYRALAAAPDARDRIAELEKRNRELTARIEAEQLDENRSEQLDELLRLSGLGRYEIVPAQAVTRVSSTGHPDTITIDAGERDGITADMTVVNGEGLVGRVLRAGTRTATVLLLTDGASSVGARLEGEREMGVAHGTARHIADSSPIRFELLDADARMSVGDRLVTMGSHEGTPFVPGVPVGTVAKVEDTPGALTRTADVAPAVDAGSLDIVGVVVSEPEEDPRDSVLPPEPEEDTPQVANNAEDAE
ncbi:rod shape-determining protein MreC [Halostreptopolyspora alba]|uniref:Cell shape-determining protein MreC n=1 Tax=Halostreptopolyspora alba TaxID=2487137 RepID=A0A3N0EHJ8_9ACTN|nr:rod shape-determining protein MreC [Nocardiopsaceae bacterium YIM 96095]